MLEIDGSIGGGSVVRLSLGLSVLTDTHIKLFNVREKRDNPGLKHQHLRGCRSIADFSGGQLKGAELGASKIEFIPGNDFDHEVEIKIPTAGSIGLALQPLLIASLGANEPVKVEVNGGGTAGKWAPPVRYLKYILGPILSRIGYEIEINILKDGFYPKGGARVRCRFHPPKKEKKLMLTEKGQFREIKGISIASKSLKHAKVAERQANRSEELLSKEFHNVSVRHEYRSTLSKGSVLLLQARYDNTVIGGDSIGEKGKPSGKVAQEAVDSLLNNIRGTVDRYAGDQLIPFLAYLGGRIKVPEVTRHIKINIKVAEQFLPIEFGVKNRVIECKWKE